MKGICCLNDTMAGTNLFQTEYFLALDIDHRKYITILYMISLIIHAHKSILQSYIYH